MPNYKIGNRVYRDVHKMSSTELQVVADAIQTQMLAVIKRGSTLAKNPRAMQLFAALDVQMKELQNRSTKVAAWFSQRGTEEAAAKLQKEKVPSHENEPSTPTPE